MKIIRMTHLSFTVILVSCLMTLCRVRAAEPLEDNFILAADFDNNRIRQISLVNDDIRTLLSTTGSPVAVIYRPADKRLIWAEFEEKQIHSSFLNGSDHKTLATGAPVDNLAIDLTSGNLYYTSNYTSYLSTKVTDLYVVTPKGDNKKIVHGGNDPEAIVVDPEEGLMFWTDTGTVQSVKKANMDGTNVTTIVSQNIKWPTGLAIDYTAKQLYISDNVLGTIQRCSYSGVCSVIHTVSGTAPHDIELSGQYLYYTVRNWRSDIIRMNKTSPSVKSRLGTYLGHLYDISIYSSSATQQPVNENCLPNKGLGDCSTICLPTQSGRTCTCRDGVSLLPNSNVCENTPFICHHWTVAESVQIDNGTSEEAVCEAETDRVYTQGNNDDYRGCGVCSCCQVLCTRNIPNGAITGLCTFLHKAACSFSCDRFYRPATTDNKITCDNGQWNLVVPCFLPDIPCPVSVDKVEFQYACTCKHGDTCTYSCVAGYTPTSSDRAITCDSGIWDNQSPCIRIDCPSEIEKVSFPGTCTFQNDEQCAYRCAAGSRPIGSDSKMTCIGGSWNKHEPCEDIECPRTVDHVLFGRNCTYKSAETCTYSCSTGYTSSDGSEIITCDNGNWNNQRPCVEIGSSTQQEEGEKTSVALVASVVVGVVVVLIVTVIVCLMRRRSIRKNTIQRTGNNELPLAQGSDMTQTRAYRVSAPIQPERPDATCNYTEFDEPGPDEHNEIEQKRIKGDVLTTKAESFAPPEEDDILNRDRTDYGASGCDASDCPKPITAKNVVKMTNLD